jgi:PTH1 family peptidyl-tRNA hydrolase
MNLVVGLGNPGRKYQGTRHNIGYEVVDRLAERFGPADFRRQFNGRLAMVEIGRDRVLLLKPETYMNLSGECVQPAAAFYRIELPNLLVICDDLNLPVGTLRIRPRGSDGGQKGLRNIAQQLASTEYARMRLGIGKNPPDRDAADYVLDRFAAEERPIIGEAVANAVDAVAVWCELGIETCMSRFN